jgi:hypothetical protein
MASAYNKALPFTNFLKERMNIFLPVHEVTFNTEDHIMNYINTWWHDIFIMSCNIILMPHMASGEGVYVTMIMKCFIL